MALAFDAASSATNIVAVTSLTYSHTCTGDNRFLLVATMVDSQVAGGSVTGVTYAGTSMTNVQSINNAAVAVIMDIWVLANPASGANDVVVTLGALNNIISGAQSFTGAHPYSSIDNSTSATASGTTSVSGSLDPVAADSWIIAHVANDAITNAGLLSPTGNNTERWEESNAGAPLVCAGGSNGPFTNSTTFGWSAGALGSDWLLSLVSIQPLITVSKSESITIAETVTRRLVSLISKSESITLTETIGMTLVHTLNVTDSTTLAELVAATLAHNVNKSESITITEALSRQVISFIAESENITVTELINATQVFNVYVKEELGPPFIIILLPHGRIAIKIHNKLYLAL